MTIRRIYGGKSIVLEKNKGTVVDGVGRRPEHYASLRLWGEDKIINLDTGEDRVVHYTLNGLLAELGKF